MSISFNSRNAWLLLNSLEYLLYVILGSCCIIFQSKYNAQLVVFYYIQYIELVIMIHALKRTYKSEFDRQYIFRHKNKEYASLIKV